MVASHGWGWVENADCGEGGSSYRGYVGHAGHNGFLGAYRVLEGKSISGNGFLGVFVFISSEGQKVVLGRWGGGRSTYIYIYIYELYD